MKKRILSCLMALALCLTLLPTAALAEETEGTAQTSPAVEESTDPANGEAKQESQSAAPEQENQSAEAKQEGQSAEQEEQQEDSAAKQAVATVQAMIDALPDAEKLDGMDDAARESACLAASEAYDAYDALREEQQSALTGADNMLAILEWATRQVELSADGYLSGHTHDESWTAINTATELTGIDKAGNYYLTDDVKLTEKEAWKPANGVVLCLNGHSITSEQSINSIIVKTSVTFTLTDCKGRGTITHAQSYTGCGVLVLPGGIFNMYNGHIMDNAVSSNSGGGVYVYGGSFNMYGGTIKSNTASYGGGVSVVNGGTFYMYGGSITDNIANGSFGAYGGGVYVSDDGSTFTMSGGSITENTTSSGNGGGVYVNGTFNMSGGTIENNTATIYSGEAYGDGGGVYVNGGTFTMAGGGITNNTATSRFGGGVCVGENAAFTVSGNVAVTENLSSGAANDVYLFSGKYITVDGKLDSKARIGVICATIDSGKSVTVATGAKGSCTEDNFFADKGEPYDIKVEQDTDSNSVSVKLYNGQPHTHCVCGKTDCTGAGHNNSTVWMGVSSLADITKAGNYYLTKDVTLTSTWTPADGVKLCLNGHTITTTANVDAIEVDQNVTFTLTDCKGTGKITHQYTDQDNKVRTATG